MQCGLKLESIPRVHVVSIQLKLHVTTQLRKNTGGTVFGKEIKSVFNSVERAKVVEN